jgi:predicted dehydrogenase
VKKIKFYRSFEKLISNEDVDAVYVTTPTSSHYWVVKRALEAGVKGVFVEKPPTINSKQLLELVDLSRGSTVMVGFQKRFALPFIHAKRILDSKALGSVRHVTGYIRSGDILTSTSRFDKLGRGVLLDLGVHLADLMTWFFGELKVTKAMFRSLYTKVDDMVEAELESPEGFRILFEASWSNPDYRLPETYMNIKLEKGTIEVTEDYLRIKEAGVSNKTFYKPNYYQGFPPVNLADPEYTIEDMHFLASLADGTKTMAELPDTLRSMELVDRLYES